MATKTNRRNRELSLIHVAKKELGLDDGEYRDLLEAWTGERSSGRMDATQRQTVIENFRLHNPTG